MGSFARTLLSSGRGRGQGAASRASGETTSVWWRGNSCTATASSTARPSVTFAPDALRALNLHRWPGNVRELQNRVQRAVIMAEGKRVTADDLELADALNATPPQT